MFLNIMYTVIVYSAVLLIEAHNLIRQKLWGEMGFAMALASLGFILTLLQVLDIAVLSPITLITGIVEDFLGIKSP